MQVYYFVLLSVIVTFYSDKGMVRSDMSKPALIFFTAGKNIAEFTNFFCTRNPIVPEVCTTLRSAHNSRVSLDRFNPCCGLHTALALLGVDISPRVWQVTILAMFSNF
jgi:hypothetical protein